MKNEIKKRESIVETAKPDSKYSLVYEFINY